MSRVASIPQAAANPKRRRARLECMRARYAYKEESKNQLAPIAGGGSWPFFKEYFSLRWLRKMVFTLGWSWLRRRFLMIGFRLQRLLFRFDKMRAYDRAFPGKLPAFGKVDRGDKIADSEIAGANALGLPQERGIVGRNDAFAYGRIAGANALSLRQENDLNSLRRSIPLDCARVEARLASRLGPVSLQAEAAAGRLFKVDFNMLKRSLRPPRNRDSRWREKYLPAPIGVFLEAPRFYTWTDLVPLAIQIDQVDCSDPRDVKRRNPVYYPDDGWAWEIAKLYFEVADVSFHVGCGHVFRTHLFMTPFCLATPRQLSVDHPVFKLLRPHTRFTLQANKAAYKYFTNRKKTYFEFYAGTLEEQRQISIESYAHDSFQELELEREFLGRNVDELPEFYPYRDDARLWIAPIRNFVEAFIREFYADDLAVQGDCELKAWAAELADPDQGAVRELVPGGRLDSRCKLIDLLTQVLFTAGPGHASQHFSSSQYYRYAPGFPAAAYAPPPWDRRLANLARFQNMLPPIGAASKQVHYNTFANLHYDKFGHYDWYPLGRLKQAQQPIKDLQGALLAVEDKINERQQGRLLPYEFLLPSRVPNSANI